MNVIPHHTSTDQITLWIDTTHADFYGNEVEACAAQNLVEAAQTALDTLMIVLKERPDLVRDVTNVLDVELLENSDAWQTFAEAHSTGEK